MLVETGHPHDGSVRRTHFFVSIPIPILLLQNVQYCCCYPHILRSYMNNRQVLMHPPSSMQYHRRSLVKVRKRLPCKELIALTLIWLALLSQLASSLNRCFRTVLLQVIIRHDFTTHKFVLKVRAVRTCQFKSLASARLCNSLNHTSCLRSLRALPNRPGPNLIRPTRKVPDQLQAAVPSLRNLRQRARRASLLLLLLLLRWLEWC
jgi:hypothetical protein